MLNIQMVDLYNQYLKIKDDVDNAIFDVINNVNFINGRAVKQFEISLSNYLGGVEVISCANGTDALQISMMALGLKPGDEVIVPSFTYVATAEVIGLLNLIPVMVDVDADSFNISIDNIKSAITKKTRAIVPVHLFGQSADMEGIMNLAAKHDLYIIEDAAQAIGAEYTFSNGNKRKVGTIGDIGCTSFFPSKNLGCFGDGGAIFTRNPTLANRIRMIANHGQVEKYKHKYIGVNSRLDTMQAAILNVKLCNLENYIDSRRKAALIYDSNLTNLNGINIPARSSNSTHVYHQYTLKVDEKKRDSLMKHLDSVGIPTMIYYPIPLNEQEAFLDISKVVGSLRVTKNLCNSVLSLPMHTELTEEMQMFVVESIKNFFKNNI